MFQTFPALRSLLIRGFLSLVPTGLHANGCLLISTVPVTAPLPAPTPAPMPALPALTSVLAPVLWSAAALTAKGGRDDSLSLRRRVVKGRVGRLRFRT